MKRLYESDVEILAGERTTPPENPNRLNRPGTRAELIADAVAELRQADFSVHDYRVLAGIRDRCTGEERDLMDRVLEIVAPRRRP